MTIVGVEGKKERGLSRIVSISWEAVKTEIRRLGFASITEALVHYSGLAHICVLVLSGKMFSLITLGDSFMHVSFCLLLGGDVFEKRSTSFMFTLFQ